MQGRVREMGVTPFYKWFEHDGVRGPNIATVYSDRGYGVRAPVVFYNRANEAGALLKPGDFDWKGIFGRGVRWFHSGGIFASLSETTAPLIVEGMQAAKAAGAINSFDLNYRAKLWASVGGAERGQQVTRQIAGQLDALIGNEEDLQMGLGHQGPRRPRQVEARSRDVLRPDRPRRRAVPQHQAGRRRPCARSTRRTATPGPPCSGSTASATSARPWSSTSSTASAAATASPPA